MDICDNCHADEASQVYDSPHESCESCHDAHAWVAPNGVCGTCHNSLPGMHEEHLIANCTDCHQEHSTQVNPEICTAACHSRLDESCKPEGCWRCHNFH
jgi:hypothetical protein